MDPLPTIYDVATRAGVAASTVSRAFARPGRVNPGTAAKVFAAANEIGYRTRSLAGLPGSRSHKIALVITDITNPFYAEIIQGAHDAAADLGYSILLSHTQEDPHVERLWIERELSSVDGVVLASSRMSDSTIRTLAKQRPFVVLNRRLPEVPSLLVDNAGGMRQAVEHLAGLGHTRITYIAGPASSWTDGVRWQALRQAARELAIDVRRVGPAPRPTIDAGFRIAAEVFGQTGVPNGLGSSRPVTALLAYNDALAIGVMKGLRRCGVVVPDDVSVVGIDNVALAAVVEPGLTSVASPLRAQGRTAVHNLVAMIAGAVPSGEALVMPARLVVRRSTAQRSRKSTSPASGTTKVWASASASARSIDSGSM